MTLSHYASPPGYLSRRSSCVQLIASVEYLRVSQEITTFQGNEEELRRADIYFAVGIWLFSLGTAVLVFDMRATVLAISKLQGRPPPPWRDDKTLQVLILYSCSLVLFGIASTLYTLPGDTSQTIGVALFVVSNVSVTSINLVGLWYLWRAHCHEWGARWLNDATLAAVDAMEAAQLEQSRHHGGVAGHRGLDDEEPVHMAEERRPPPSSSATSVLLHHLHPRRDDMPAAAAAPSESGGDDNDEPPSVRSSLGDDTPNSGASRRHRVSLSVNRPGTPRADGLANIDEAPVVSDGTRHALAAAGLLPSARVPKARVTTRLARHQSFDRVTGSPRAATSDVDGGTPPLSLRSSAGSEAHHHHSGGDSLPPSSVGALSQASSGEGAEAPGSGRGHAMERRDAAADVAAASGELT
jgi:hypothetical protein